jgi:hypothetical protein
MLILQVFFCQAESSSYNSQINKSHHEYTLAEIGWIGVTMEDETRVDILASNP